MSTPTLASRNTIAVTLLAAAMLAFGACAGASSVSPASPSTAPATISPSPSPAPATPSPTATSPSPLPGFTTEIPPAADQPWTSITWRALATGDPLGDIRTVVRWVGGFVAVGLPVVADGSSRTPVWTSPDGAAWSALDPAALGTSTVVLDVVPAWDGLAALTLQGGTSPCSAAELRIIGLDCPTLVAPLQVFTTDDGLRWTAHPGPDLPLADEYGSESGWTYRPHLVAGEPGLLAYLWERPVLDASRPTVELAVARDPAPPEAPGLASTEARGPCRLAYSADGIAWETLPAAIHPADFICTDIAPVAGGFAAVGSTRDEGAGVLWSADGRAWEEASTPASGWLAGSIAAGSAGVVAECAPDASTGNPRATPGPWLSWSSTDGRAWTIIEVDGTLVADGERFVNDRSATGLAARTSFDGRTWTPVEITPTAPSGSGRLLALPIGMLWIGDDGTTWFGEPTAR